MIVGAADAYVILLHWLLRADETEGLSLGMESLILHEEVSGPGDVTLRLPTSKTDQRGNGASRRLTCICMLPAARSLFDWAIDDKGEDRPLFPRTDGSRASKTQLAEARGVATAQGEKPTGHSPRRSGAKRYARQGWSVWMIQFMGRWAASAVLENVEEAMAEITACWEKCPASCSAGNLGASDACRVTWSTGGCPKLSEQVDRIEQIILDTKARLAQSESQCGQLAQKQTELEDRVRFQQWVWKTTDKCEVDCTVHLVVEESLDWPNALWTTRCWWRFGAARFSMRRWLAGVPEVCADGVVGMMRAFGSGGRLGPIIALSHRCPAIARGHSSLEGL